MSPEEGYLRHRASGDPVPTATDKRHVKQHLFLQHRYNEGFKLLQQPMDGRYNAIYASQETPGAILEETTADHARYHRLCPEHRQALDPEGRCQKHKPRRWHVAELLPNKSWKILFRDVC